MHFAGLLCGLQGEGQTAAEAGGERVGQTEVPHE